MEKDTLHRAADSLTELLKAHVSDSPKNVHVYDALAARDDLRELARSIERANDLPEVGDLVWDENHNPHFGNGWVVVTEVLPNAKAKTHYIDVPTGKRSVAYKNPGYSEDAPIVKGRYRDGSYKVYTFPADRLVESPE